MASKQVDLNTAATPDTGFMRRVCFDIEAGCSNRYFSKPLAVNVINLDLLPLRRVSLKSL